VIKLAAVAVSAAAIGGFLWYAPRDGCERDAAYAAVQEEVSKHLKSPASAIFPDWEAVSSGGGAACYFDISGYVDSQNSFGAVLRTTYSGVYGRDESGNPKFILLLINGGLPGL